MNVLSADIEKELKSYIEKHDINNLFKTMAEALLLDKPENPHQFVVDYLAAKFPDAVTVGATGGGGGSDSDSDSSDDDDDVVDELPELPERLRTNRRRTAVSAEAGVDPAALRKQWEATKQTYPKNESEREKLRGILAKNLLFQRLDGEQTSVVIDSMFPVTKGSGEVIIQQGDAGDLFYVVEAGNPEVYVGDTGAGDGTKVLTYETGDSFGELALMYNAPRAATVKAGAADVTLWALDRLTFKVILMETTQAKRDLHKGFLEKVPILDSLSEYERLTIADALKEESVAEEGKDIIKQDDVGDKFYIIKSGSVSCLRREGVGAPETEVMRLGEGDYFGEISLLTDSPRKATVKTLTPVTVLSLDRRTFERVMGPLKDILKRNMARYESVMRGAL
jgi:cAMP-dependent protein kinase regulator